MSVVIFTRSIGQKEIVVLFTAFIGVTYGFGIYLFPAAVESIRLDIPFSYTSLGWLTGFVQAGFLVSSLLAGFLTLRFGAINLILFSLILCAGALAALVFANSVLAIAVPIMLLGVCASLIWVPMVEVAREIISPKNRGKALGLMSSGTSYGVFVNSVLLVSVMPAHGWRALWAVSVVIVVVLTAYATVRLRRLRGRRHRQESAPSAAPSDAPVGGLARIASLPRILVGMILLTMFFNGFACTSFQTYLSPYLIGEVGLENSGAALAWRIIGLVGMFGGFLMGALADRITLRRGMIVSYLILCVATIALVSGEGDGLRIYLIHLGSVAFGLSFYSIFGLMPAYISHVFKSGNAAIVFAFGNVALGVGGVVGNLTGGYTKELFGSFDVLYLSILAAAIASIAITSFLPSETDFDSGHGVAAA